MKIICGHCEPSKGLKMLKLKVCVYYLSVNFDTIEAYLVQAYVVHFNWGIK